MLGTVVTQFVILHAEANFRAAAKALATICYVAAISTLCVGAFRSWRYQHALLRGKALAGGLELNVVGGSIVVVSGTSLSLARLAMAKINIL